MKESRIGEMAKPGIPVREPRRRRDPDVSDPMIEPDRTPIETPAEPVTVPREPVPAGR